ncbi:MAG: dipeptide epimerase [Saprospirales bacterium]|nr:MAG: dipeptide epimerase [Saprospirales bacterium]
MKLSFATYRLELKDTFTISHGSYEYRDTMIVELERDGIKGYGEATVIPYLGVSLEGLKKKFNEVADTLSTADWAWPEDLWKIAEPKLRGHSFLLSAIDCAAWDWFGKKKGRSVRGILKMKDGSTPISSYTIGYGTFEEMKRKMDAAPWSIYKIKLSSRNDLELVKKLRETNDAVFRIDANGSWDPHYLYEDYSTLKDLNVDLIEQPLPVGMENNLDKSRHSSSVPVIADESCSRPGDVAKCMQWFDGINIKLMKCGGITPALEMIRRAKSLGLKVMGGCMTESSVGISAMAHLSPLFDYVDLDGAALLSNDPAGGVVVDRGNIEFPDTPGLGCFLK